MKRFFRMTCLALVAIAASVTMVSCSSDSDSDSFSPSALGIVYGFNDNIFNNYDLKFNYTDENDKTVTEDIKKADTEVTETVINGETYEYYQWSKVIVFNKSLASGKAYVTATKKTNYAIQDDSKYSWYTFHGSVVVTPNTSKTQVASRTNLDKLSGKNAIGSRFDEIVQNALATCKDSYSVGSDGTLKLAKSTLLPE